MLNVPPSPVLHAMTPGSFVVVQKVPLGTRAPGATGVPGGGFAPPRLRCGVGVATAQATRAKAVMKIVDRILILLSEKNGAMRCNSASRAFRVSRKYSEEDNEDDS
jgi:hypothetical protein